ncbi:MULTISPECIES: hypothetical protein [unclassified Curtobacterium]|uniref:hypothetical protein n=1 Tax=unclassified Curtobacterium TaxID=257496 RepID=UPI0011133FB3|nr:MULTISPECIES: hypothetical protein [unclassified Curtobacterium]
MPERDMLDRLIRTPVRTDDDVVQLVAAVVDGPVTRQCWVLFFDDRAVPVPFLIPIADLPYEPDEHVDDFASLVRDIVEQIGAAEVVLVWERPGADRLFPADWEWVDACACSFEDHRVRLRGQVVVHALGAAMVELEDLDRPEAVAS